MKTAIALLLLFALQPSMAAETPQPAPDQTLVERVHARRAVLHDDLDTLNARWREATDPRVRREIARAISLAKVDFEIGVLELQRAERGPDAETPVLDASLDALRSHRKTLVDPKDEGVEPTEDDGAREDS